MFNHQNNFYNYLIFFFPFTIYSSFALDLIISAIAVFGIFYISKNYKFIKFKKKTILPFAILYLLLIINLLFSNDVNSTISRNILYLRFFIFALFFIFILQKQKINLNYLILGIEINLIFLIFDGFFQYHFGYDLFGRESSGLRLSGPFSRLILGSITSKLLIILFVCYYVTGKLNLKKIFLIICPGLLIVFLSGERSAFYVSVFCTLLIIFSLKYNFIYKTLFLIITLFLGFVFLINNNLYYDRYVTQTLNTVLDKNTGNTSQYKQHFITSIEIFKENIITGAGIKNFRKECAKPKYKDIGNLRCSTHPHNVYFEILSEMGLLGIIFLLILFYIIFINIIKNNIFYPRIIISSPFLLFFFPFQTSTSFFNNYTSSFFWFTFIVIVITIKYEKK